ncbi:MAG TPA: acetyl-CoA carboxylase carboxyltransferase subunit alpha [Thermoanaerobaculia bacterium]|nr:acetyl-CoA carboxylase carboxyltransferase subunit alpha [Thermoanaerobaculia bacterium]
MPAPGQEELFEEPIETLRRRIEELESFPEGSPSRRELESLRRELKRTSSDVFRRLDAWQRTQVARHLGRPYTLDFVRGMMSDWVELHGDRAFGDDPAMVAGFATFRGRTVAVVGHEKGRGTTERIRRNFGQAHPEGHRKALRVMKLAARFGRPVVSLIDTPGAYPGTGAEERGQAESIASNLIEMAALPVPIVAVITGEGWSGGALAIGVADRVLMLEHAVHSVITPEGCAAILWRDQERKAEAAEALKITAPDLLRLGVVDEIIPEPPGGAQADHEETFRAVGDRLDGQLRKLERRSAEDLVRARYDRFRVFGAFEER